VRGHNPLENRIDVIEHILVPESNNSEPKALKILRPPIIVVVPFYMLSTVQLDDQAPLETAEIDDEREDLILAAKL
jgi:hypothetical protein